MRAIIQIDTYSKHTDFLEMVVLGLVGKRRFPESAISPLFRKAVFWLPCIFHMNDWMNLID